MQFRWDHASLAVNDIDEGIAFFGQAFGFEVVFLERGMTGQIASMLGIEGVSCDLVQLTLPRLEEPRLELIAFRTPYEGSPPDWPILPGMGHVAIRVGDFDAAIAKAATLGARPIGAITQFREGRSVYLKAPCGAFLEIEELLPIGRLEPDAIES